jgi:lipopolysaccharide export system permease protein
MRARRGGFAASALSIGFFLVYYLFLIGGEQLADRTIVSPAVAMWAPNVVLALPALWLTWGTISGRDIGRG